MACNKQILLILLRLVSKLDKSQPQVVTSVDSIGRPKQVIPTNSEWVSLFQEVCASGASVPPFIIIKAKGLDQRWFFQGLPWTWASSVGVNGWPTNEIGLQWIRYFEKYIYKQRHLEIESCLYLTTIGVIPHQYSEPSVRRKELFCSRCHLIIHTSSNH